ncbi:MAG TPA: hypothetical protein PLW95_06930 [bacterium]|nr:hypothetical protein [bacterium]
MKKIDLKGKWMLLGCEPKTGLPADIIKPELEKEQWLIADVPGDVNATLLKYNKIPNPHYDTQGRDCYWVTEKEWWYKLVFDASDVGNAKADLCLEGVDGHADIYLNNKYLGEMKNAFRQFRFNITGLLKLKKNVLLIRFKSIDQLLGGSRIDELLGWRERRAFIRKPQFSFGWDWALPIPSIGLSGNVWIEYHNEFCIKEFSIQTFMNGRIDFSFEVSKGTKLSGYSIIINIDGYGQNITKEIRRNTFKSYTSINIENPKLWFPNGYGEQPLYHYSIGLLVSGNIVDKKEGYFGIRESKIIEEPFTPEAGHGFSFRITINGESIFCKGANWVPLELWPVNATEEQYRFYLNKAKEANFNMLRVWGGGIYEPEIFYKLCDELGIMVWQDFMFASSGYPVDLLRDEIIAEANYQIRRLRNHPCIVIWCGCNEDIYSWSYPEQEEDDTQQDSGVYSKKESEDKWKVDRLKDDPQIYTMILRGLVSKFGLDVPYVDSSPSSKDDYGNMPNSGNSHISCWKYSLFESDGKPEQFRKHFEKVCSFDSEFCIQGPCAEKTFKKFFSPDNLWPPNQAWVYHIQRGHANLPHHEQTIFIAGAIFGKIDSLEKYVKFGQATHVEMMRAEFESARRDRPNNGGTMVWMFNDCWPTSNWSIIDYYRCPKPAFYAAKRACATLLPIIFERSEKIEFFFSNDSSKNAEVELLYGQETLQGNQVWSKHKKLTIDKNSTKLFDAIERDKMVFPIGDFLYIDAIVNNKKLPRVIYFPDGWKDIQWPHPNIEIKFIDQKFFKGKWNTTIKLRTDTFARFCHIILKENDSDISFSDNYFDMSASSDREINIQSDAKIDINNLIIGNWWTKWE